MRILIVSNCPSHPTTAGNRRFIKNQADLLTQMGHEVHYLYVSEVRYGMSQNEADKMVEVMRCYWENRLHMFKVGKLELLRFSLVAKWRALTYGGHMKCDDEYPSGLGRFVRNLDGKHHFDCCIINYYILSRLLTEINISIKAITTHDYFSFKDLLLDKRKTWIGTTADQEAKALQRCPNILALNLEEAIFFSKLSPKSRIYNVYSIYTHCPSAIIGNRDLLFLSGSNPLNVSGLTWFINNIFPSIISVFPTTRLLIGGSICNVLDKHKLPLNVILKGYVETTADFYGLADVVINPTYQGTGLKIKTFESISYDKVTMTHPHSMIGIYEANNAPIFSSTSPDEWVNYLKKVWTEPNFIQHIKQQNKAYIESLRTYVINEYKRLLNQ